MRDFANRTADALMWGVVVYVVSGVMLSASRWWALPPILGCFLLWRLLGWTNCWLAAVLVQRRLGGTIRFEQGACVIKQRLPRLRLPHAYVRLPDGSRVDWWSRPALFGSIWAAPGYLTRTPARGAVSRRVPAARARAR